MCKSISLGDALRDAWKAVSDPGGYQYFFGLCALILLSKYIPKMGLNLASKSVSFNLYMALQFVNLCWQVALWMFVIKMFLRLVDGRSDLENLWDSSSFKSLINFFLNSMFNALILLPFAILALFSIKAFPASKGQIALTCALPTLVILGRIYFGSFLVVDLGLGPINALKSSWRKTEGLTIKLFGFTILLGFINGMGVLLGFFGMAMAFPIVMLAMTSLYRQLVPSREPPPTSTQMDIPMDPRRLI